MNTKEINDQLKSMKCFIGTYPIDKLPKKYINQRPLGLIINLDQSYLPGSHWIALFIDDNNIAWYFDSYGRDINSKYIHEFLVSNKVSILFHNRKKLQGDLSQVCGPYCIYFIKMMCSSFEPEEFIQMFSKNKHLNDRFVVKILQ